MAWICDWETFARHVYAEALRLGLRKVGRVVVIGDYADWIDRLQSECFPGAIRIADFWHTCEYLAEAAREAHGEGTAATRKWLHVVRGKLRRGQLAAVRRALQALPAGESRTAAMRYLRKHHKKMRYDTYRAAGLPIGSGAVEGRCKNLVGTRFKRTGSLACRRRVLVPLNWPTTQTGVHRGDLTDFALVPEQVSGQCGKRNVWEAVVQDRRATAHRECLLELPIWIEHYIHFIAKTVPRLRSPDARRVVYGDTHDARIVVLGGQRGSVRAPAPA